MKFTVILRFTNVESKLTVRYCSNEVVCSQFADDPYYFQVNTLTTPPEMKCWLL